MRYNWRILNLIFAKITLIIENTNHSLKEIIYELTGSDDFFTETFLYFDKICATFFPLIFFYTQSI